MTRVELAKDLDLLMDCTKYPNLFGKKLPKVVKARILAAFDALRKQR